MRAGILGGSFNPPHRGHLSLARAALASGRIDRVILIPAAAPPHKAVPTQADTSQRLAMTRLLARGDAALSVDDLELRRAGPSYTVDTVRALLAGSPGLGLRLIIGSDLAKTFATWREYRELLRLAPPLVAERPDDRFGEPPAETYRGMSPEEIRIMEEGRFAMPPVDVSSTRVRRMLAEGAGDAELLEVLTEPVLRYIRERGLYRGGGGSDKRDGP